ncbi:MAG: type II toxin-antitoxin system death-on-curing family toxin [Chitinophagales bacterium]|nr:type II toxin-antitoxin system death-on-curing family toxin [Saprospirales bacterium]MBP6661107.1 type II toxin-antitoxin system death-on-curing family toxin [Chitinophagales bacterium]HUM52354.1 type II toxin-antitoxin system death-on-curing family toxin [Chitinophagales bacterium]
MILFEEVIEIHNKAIDRFGGKNNIRDAALLESALNRPFATFDGIDLYPTLIEKTAALAESIIKNHPFHDGNKRIGFLILIALLNKNKIDIIADENLIYDFVIAIAEGKLDFDAIVDWLKNNTTNIQ